MKSARIRSFSGPNFPAFGLNTERYGVSLRIQSECGKIRNKITPNTDNFHAVRQSSLKLLFHDILRMNCHVNFKCDSINFLQAEEVTNKISAPGHCHFKNDTPYSKRRFLIVCCFFVSRHLFCSAMLKCVQHFWVTGHRNTWYLHCVLFKEIFKLKNFFQKNFKKAVFKKTYERLLVSLIRAEFLKRN